MSEQEKEDFVFDPTQIVGASTEQKTDEKAEKLNLFNDTIFDLDEKPDKENKDITKESDENSLSPDEIKNKKDESLKSVFSVALGQDLMERGVLSSFDEEEISKIAQEQGEDAAIMKMFESQASAINEEIKSTYDEGYKEYLNMIQGGATKEEAVGINQLDNYQKSIKDLDLKSDDNIDARKNLLTLHYRLTTKWSEDKIQKYIEKSVDEGSDLDEVDEALTNLNAYVTEEKQSIKQRAEQAKIDAQKAQEKMVNDYKSYIDKTDEYFAGEKVSKQIKEKIQKALLDPVKLENGVVTNHVWAKRAENPISFDAKVAYLDSIGFFDNKPLDKFIKKAETKSTTRLAEFLNDNKGRDVMKSMNRSFTDKESKEVDLFESL